MLKKTVLVRALSIAFSAAALTAAVVSPVMAQSNATGIIGGQVDSPSTASIQLTNLDTGLKRTVTPDQNGRYQATALPVGRYKVDLVRGGAVVSSTQVEALVGQGVDASFVGAATQTVEVSGRRARIDMSNTTNSTTFTARELKALPIAQSVGAIIQLTPGTTRGDSRYGDTNAPSIGGASASENSFYINGFPVTNVLLQVGGSELPFGSIANAQILTGGYGAEFGRSTGGVSNITTKSGTNNWEIGSQVTWTPKGLRSKEKNIYYPNNLGKPTDGQVYFYNEDNTADRKTAAVWVGGPIIKDQLFMYANFEFLNNKFQDNRLANSSPATHLPNTTNPSTSSYANGWEEINNKISRSIIKLDWNITDNHRLEYTFLGDMPKSDRKYYSYDFNNNQRGTVQTGGVAYKNWGPTPAAAAIGAETNIIKYTGNLTDNLTLTGLYGKSKVEHEQTPFGFVPGVAQVILGTGANASGVNYPIVQQVSGTLLTPGAYDDQKVYRVDLEYKLGNHTLRAGLDNDKISSRAGTSTAGGSVWNYDKGTPGVSPYPGASPVTGGLGNGYYVYQTSVSGVSTPSVEQSAQYVEDRYQISKDVLLIAGLRNEQFTNYNGDGQAYYSQRHQLAPRFGASWDVTGDGAFKVFGSAGRYHLQIPTNVAVRGAGSSLNTRQYYTYTGVDQATGAPTGLVAISPLLSANNEFGQAKDPRTVAAVGMKSHYQDEISAGFEKALTRDYVVSGKATYRKLQSTVDDFCDGRPFDTYAIAHKIDTTHYDGFNCALFNPGIDNTFNVAYGGASAPMTVVHLTAAELGYDKVIRTYKSLDLGLEHPFRNGWYAKAVYTWSQSYGNTEGQTLSDIGQADVATTQVFDYPEIGLNSTGLTPNNRSHQLKAFGYYELNQEWAFGGNGLVASGRPKNCIGNLPASYGADNPAAGYGSAFFFCNGVATPRGSQGRLPVDVRLDVSTTYKPSFAKGMQFKVDVFNLFNRQAAQNINEVYNTNATTVSPVYGRVISYTAPRSMKLTAEYNHKF